MATAAINALDGSSRPAVCEISAERSYLLLPALRCIW